MSDAPTGSASTRTLTLAARTLGGAPALARRLDVEPAALDPKGAWSGQFRQVKPKDGAPASNKPDAPENKQSKS